MLPLPLPLVGGSDPIRGPMTSQASDRIQRPVTLTAQHPDTPPLSTLLDALSRLDGAASE